MAEAESIVGSILLWGVMALGLLALTIVWLIIAYAVIRLGAEFIKAYKNADTIEDAEESEYL